ncbi:MAG: cytochrome c [Deltaproteobacteria bacterium]|nr:cytochrome c [Deltaproteobacteria bacterium]
MKRKNHISIILREALNQTAAFPVMLLIAVAIWGCTGKQETEAPKAEVPAPMTAENAPAIKKQQGDPTAGKLIYVKYCHFCHGQKGLGDGPVGLAISPHPADFVNDTKRMSKTDEELFKSISDGIKREIGGDAMFMPSWKEILSEKERWDVLFYVRQLEREGKAARR